LRSHGLHFDPAVILVMRLIGAFASRALARPIIIVVIVDRNDTARKSKSSNSKT
jgi:hypothetical protein